MLDLVIFTGHPTSYAPVRFSEEAFSQGVVLQIVDYDDVDLKSLPDTKYVILREPDASKNIYGLRDEILRHYLSTNSFVLNANSYLEWSVFDKITQHIEFQKADIPHLTLLKLEQAKYPFIAKAKLGSHGSHVYKITSKDDLNNVLKNYKKEDLLFQEFQNSGFDLRVIVLDGKVLGIMKRTPKSGNFLSNYSQGGSVNKYNEDNDSVKTIKQIALKTASHFQLDYCGVDLMKGNDGEWKVLEVNRACQFQGFEKAIKVNVAKSVLEYLTYSPPHQYENRT